ncbi:MAG TPA: helix-turn-helix transcriptional regulator [Actinomycetota bacterium]|jgi:DNA-binding NarL/FixJ family response regulator|nr:helix-turn-helix transcriptional regulator [Actinomycetota bacterium]
MTALVSVAEDGQVEPVTLTIRVKVDRAIIWRVWQLTARERQILQGAADGLTDREIGGRLGCSTRTVGSHMQAINRKLGTHSRTQAVLVAITALAVRVPDPRLLASGSLP